MAADSPVVREIFIDASPEEVFPYLTISARYSLWMGIAAELDPRPGGVYRVDANGRNVILGKYVEVSPPRRVVFTWGFADPESPVPAGSTTVEIDLIPQGRGTLLRLVHRGSPPERRGRHEQGWSHYLARLQIAAAGADPGRDPFADPSAGHD
ncbi:MAG: SRPBCC domain-containing protein [Myxococcota bacterium]